LLKPLALATIDPSQERSKIFLNFSQDFALIDVWESQPQALS
jgi:hypothetical protein